MVSLVKCTIRWIATILQLLRFTLCAFKFASFLLEFSWCLRVLCKHSWRKLKQRIKELSRDFNRRWWRRGLLTKKFLVKTKFKWLRSSKMLKIMNHKLMKNSQVDNFYPILILVQKNNLLKYKQIENHRFSEIIQMMNMRTKQTTKRKLVIAVRIIFY